MTENYTPDIFHDVLEGYGGLVLQRMLLALVHDRVLTLRQINDGMQSLALGRTDASNRPKSISRLSIDDSLRQSGMEMFCLLRMLPLMIGDLVPRGNPYWGCYLALRELMDLLFAQKFTETMIDHLRHVTRAFLKLYLSTFPGQTITPKMHFALHNPRCVEMTGPLYMTMVAAQEQKMKQFKQLARTSRSRTNIPLTLAKRYSDYFVHSISSCYNDGGLEVGTCNLATIRTLPLRDEVCAHFGLVEDDVVVVANTLTNNGTAYCPRDLVATGLNDDCLPTFFQIVTILTSDRPDRCPLFLGHAHRTVEFDRHLYAYRLELNNTFCHQRLDSISDHHPLDLYRLKNGYYVVARYLLLAE